MVAAALVAVGVAYVVADDGGRTVLPSPTASSGERQSSGTDAGPGSGGAMPVGLATRTLDRLARALGHGDAVAAAALGVAGDGEAADRLRAAAEAAADARVRGLRWRYVDSLGTPDADGTWWAATEVTWRFAGVDESAATAEVLVGLRTEDGPDGTTVAVVDPAAVAEDAATATTTTRVPVWLSGPVRVRQDAGTMLLVATPDGSVDDRAEEAADEEALAAQVRRARQEARRALAPGERSAAPSLVVEVPADASGVDAALGVSTGTYAAIAAVTAPVDGEDGPVHVLVNPDELGQLRPAGAQVVLTHEAVHALTDAPASLAPLWLVEGYADEVALRDVDLPLSVTSAQVLAEVAQEGLPRALPTTADFGVSSRYLGAAYEAAWTACRVLAARAGEDGLRRVYERTGAGEGLDAVLADVAGWTQRDLVRAWRAELARIADGG
ncbi:hypothetical protein M8316_16720 [Nocardioides sp. BSK12Z-3]|nr:hypothetical protein [Nocardioides bruguierae]